MKLEFGKFDQSSSFGVTRELKEKVTFKKGPATIGAVDIQEHEQEGEDGAEPSRWRNIAIRIKGVEGGGCFDSITTRTPSKYVLGLQRIKYLFGALGMELPDIEFLKYAVNGAKDRFTKKIVDALTEYVEDNGTLADVAQINNEGQIIFTSLTAMNEILGENHGVSYQYADLGAVAKLKFAHDSNLMKIGNDESEETQEARKSAKQEYYAQLDAQPVVPCQINEESLDELYDAISAIDKDSVFECETKERNRKQVKSYTKLS